MRCISKTIVAEIVASKPGNPRNSEGDFIRLKDGSIHFVWSRFTGDSGDDEARSTLGHLVLRETDAGRYSFEDLGTLLEPEDGIGANNVMSVTLRHMQDGSAGLFYIQKYTDGTDGYYLRRCSPDDLSLQGPAIDCLGYRGRGYHVINNDRVLRLSDGRLLIPAARSRICSSPDGSVEFDRNWETVFSCSEDDGFSWHILSPTLTLSGNAHSWSGLQEPGIVELPGGTLYAFMRTDLGRQYESLSADGGRTWSAPQPSACSSPCSPMQIKKNPYSGIYYAIWNPIPESPFLTWLLPDALRPLRWTGGRTPLVMAASRDGIHFGEACIIEDKPFAEYSYPAVFFTNEANALLAYTAGGEDESGGRSLESCPFCLRIVSVTLPDKG
ncbi:MAG: exo-alpha-sialidase [Clostridia bacterium]|nr:exo-alpha-sialidase [Clostridia bacterium]